MPKRPDLTHIQDLAQRVGNDQLKAIFDQRERLTHEINDWKARADKIAQREPRWHALLALLHHADGLPIGTHACSEVAAITQNRGLLANPDPVPGMIDTVTQALRDALNEARTRCEAARSEGASSLDASETWKRLTPADRESLKKKYQLDQLPAIKVGSAEEVLDTLQATKLPEWGTLRDAIPTRFKQALSEAAKVLEPKAQHVKLPGGTIKDDDDLKSWLKSAEDQIRAKLKDGPVIL